MMMKMTKLKKINGVKKKYLTPFFFMVKCLWKRSDQHGSKIKITKIWFK